MIRTKSPCHRLFFGAWEVRILRMVRHESLTLGCCSADLRKGMTQRLVNPWWPDRILHEYEYEHEMMRWWCMLVTLG